jgi:DNA-binding transcriptional MerR regulator
MYRGEEKGNVAVMLKDTWTRKEVAEITGIPDRRILFYTEQPLLLPGVKRDTGRGTARVYNIESVFYLLLIKELSSLGLSLARIRLVLSAIRAAAMPRIPDQEERFGLPELKLWENGQFTKTPVIIILSMDDTSDSVSMGFAIGDQDIHFRVDRSSQIILNLNLIFNKANV